VMIQLTRPQGSPTPDKCGLFLSPVVFIHSDLKPSCSNSYLFAVWAQNYMVVVTLHNIRGDGAKRIVNFLQEWAISALVAQVVSNVGVVEFLCVELRPACAKTC
jgi:hypothetical protein